MRIVSISRSIDISDSSENAGYLQVRLLDRPMKSIDLVLLDFFDDLEIAIREADFRAAADRLARAAGFR
jgi:hypothetical protein